MTVAFVMNTHGHFRSLLSRALTLLACLLGSAHGTAHGQTARYPVGDQELSNVPAGVTDHVAAERAQRFEISTVVDGLDFLTAHELLPDGSLIIAEKGGRLLYVDPQRRIKLAGQRDVDQQGARGLLNVIAHPQFTHNRELILYESVREAPESDKQRVIALKLRADGTLDRQSERVLVRGLHGADGFEQGGGLAADRHGHLFVGVGDGGCRRGMPAEPAYKPGNYFATCLSNGNGKILRVGLDGSIPADNPLVSVSAVTACGPRCSDDPWSLPLTAPRRDIWAWGVRNPWRLWIDGKTDRLWLVDDGDITHEEVDVIAPQGGVHLGWPWREGAAGHPRSVCQKVTPQRGDCTDPAYYCKHGAAQGEVDGGCQSMGGGLAVDDSRWPRAERGRYFFGDCSNGGIWSLDLSATRDGVVPRSRRAFAGVRGMIVDMDVAADGGMYVGVLELPPATSRIVRIAPRKLAWRKPRLTAPAH